MKHIKKFNEMVEVDETKNDLEAMFPHIDDLEKIGSGKFGHAYLGTIGHDMVVVKMTSSLSEYYLSKAALLSNPPHTVKFHNVETFDESRHLYAIVHDYVNRDAMPSEYTWDLYIKYRNGMVGDNKISTEIVTREQKYEFNLAKAKVSELEDYFNTDIDCLWQNWGYDNNGDLVIFDLDGNFSKPRYDKFLSKI